jgi:predicted flap endonuclease-1-like 5' DNA nuclease
VQIASARLDRLGLRRDVAFRPFTGGLNAVYLPDASDRWTVGRFLRAMIFAEDQSDGAGPVSASIPGGELALRTTAGQHTVRSQVGPDTRRRFTLETEDRLPGATAWLGALNAEPGFGPAPWFLFGASADSIHRLVNGRAAAAFRPSGAVRASEQARGLQLQLAALRRQLAELPEPDAALPEAGRGNASLAALTLERRRLQQELDALLTARPAYEAERQRLSDELRYCDAQLERWHAVAGDLESHGLRLQQETQRAAGCPRPDPRQRIQSLQVHADKLRQSVAESHGDDGCPLCQHQRWRGTAAATVNLLREDLARLGGEFSRWEAAQESRGFAAELGRLDAARQHLHAACEDLRQRRRRLAAELAEIESGTLRDGYGPHGRHCQCSWNGSAGRSGHHAALAEGGAAYGADVEAIRRDLARLDEWIGWARQREQLAGEIAALEAELAHAEPARADSPLTVRASALLAALSGERRQRIEVAESGAIAVFDGADRPTSVAQLGQQARSRVYLSLCLALAEAYRREETELPLVVDDDMLAAEPTAARRAVEVLAEFAQAGHQVVLLTSRDELAARLRQQGVAVHELPALSRPAPQRDPRPAVAPPPPPRLVETWPGTGDVPHRRSDQAHGYNVWSCEEFPGELTDRADLPQTARTPPDDEAEASLLDATPIEDALDIDAESLGLLRKIGIARASDLLRVDADDAARRLHHTGITAATVRQWQDRCRQWRRGRRERTLGQRRLSSGRSLRIDGQAAGHALWRPIRTALDAAAPFDGDSADESADAAWEQPAARPVAAAEAPRGLRFYLDPADSVVDAPSIGPRMAEQLEALGIRTVAQLLAADPSGIAARLDNRRVAAETVRQWQRQAALASRIPGLRGHDAQILVACGITQPEELAVAAADALWAQVAPFSETNEGKRIIRNGPSPDLDEVRDWIHWASLARP